VADYGIFYEFVPVEDLDSPTPRRHGVADVELGRPYAVAISTPAGLWSYLLGDTVRFTRREPLRLQITGRIGHCLGARGENVTVEQVERAIVRACARTAADVVEFTVAPRHPSKDAPQPGHEWLMEFRDFPCEPEEFSRILDDTLAALNRDYRARRTGCAEISPPRVTALPPGTFHRWMRQAGRLGHPHKVPRVTGDRTLAEALLAAGHRRDTPTALPHSA